MLSYLTTFLKYFLLVAGKQIRRGLGHDPPEELAQQPACTSGISLPSPRRRPSLARRELASTAA
jgi:hypothetical protein